MTVTRRGGARPLGWCHFGVALLVWTAAGAQDAPVPAEAVMPDSGVGNPLWRIPLDHLGQTKARPPFTPSRRAPAERAPEAPPPAPVAEAPVERPLELTLVGVVRGIGQQSIALFVDASGQNTIRLKEGDQTAGWTLGEVRSREVVMKNGSREQSFALTTHGPGAGLGQPADQ